VNDLDGKIKQINTTKPEFTQLPAGNYTVHALVFGPTVVPTGLVVGNKLAQVVPFCGTTATKALRVQSICSSAMSYTETITNAKQYALLDTSTNQFVQVNTTGKFAMIHTGMPHQVIGFNYTGTATGIQVGGTIAGVTATNLDMTAGAIVSGCTAIITQIDGNIYNDKDKRCVEGLNNQTGLPQVTLYAKLLDSSNQVIAVSSAIQSPDYTFSIAPNLLDGVYSIVLDDNDSVTDAVATYPTSWKGNAQTFTIESGQIVEYLSNTANFVPMCMQSATNKPILKPTANLVGNTYNYCQGATTSSIIIDALPGAIVNWYTQLVGGVAKTTPLIPDTSVVGTTTCYVSQTLNGAESDRAEVIISVHALPDQPTAIEGNNFIAAGTTQLYSVVNSSSVDTYNWILPTDWTGSSTTKDITIVVGDKSATIGVTATSAYGCVSPIQQLDVRVVIEDDIEVYNSLSPNGDGKNDIFVIRNIDFYPENTLSIYNRWGIEVYRVNSYGQNDNFFKGFSDGRFTVSRDVELPEGAYFYTLTYKNTKGIEKNLSGYLYIKQ
jgi:gliding motility-associated-like protein